MSKSKSKSTAVAAPTQITKSKFIQLKSRTNLTCEEIIYHKHLAHAFFDQLWTVNGVRDFSKRGKAYEILALISPSLLDKNGEVHFTNLDPEGCKLAVKNLFIHCLKLSDNEAAGRTEEYFRLGIDEMNRMGFCRYDDPIVPRMPKINLQKLFLIATEKKKSSSELVSAVTSSIGSLINDPTKKEQEDTQNANALKKLESRFKWIFDKALLSKIELFKKNGAQPKEMIEGFLKTELAEKFGIDKWSENDQNSIRVSIRDAIMENSENLEQLALKHYLGYVKVVSKGQYSDYAMLHNFETGKRDQVVTIASSEPVKAEAVEVKPQQKEKQLTEKRTAPKKLTAKEKAAAAAAKDAEDDALLEAAINSPEHLASKAIAAKEKELGELFFNILSSMTAIFKDSGDEAKEQFRDVFNKINYFTDQIDPSNPRLFIILSEIVKITLSLDSETGRKKYFDDLIIKILNKLNIGDLAKDGITKAFKESRELIIKIKLGLPSKSVDDLIISTFYCMIHSKYGADEISSFMRLFQGDDVMKYLVGTKSINFPDTNTGRTINLHRAGIFASFMMSLDSLSPIIEEAGKLKDSEILEAFLTPTNQTPCSTLSQALCYYKERPNLADSILKILLDKRIDLSKCDGESLKNVVFCAIKYAPEKLKDVLSLIKNSKAHGCNIADASVRRPESEPYLIDLFQDANFPATIKKEILLQEGVGDGYNGLMVYSGDNSNYEMAKAILEFAATDKELFKSLITKQCTETKNNALQLALVNDAQIAGLILDKVREMDGGKIGEGSLMHTILSQKIPGPEGMSINAIGFAAITADNALYETMENLYKQHGIKPQFFPDDEMYSGSICHIILNYDPVDYKILCQKLSNLQVRTSVSISPEDAIMCLPSIISGFQNRSELPIETRMNLVLNFEKILSSARGNVAEFILEDAKQSCDIVKQALGLSVSDEVGSPSSSLASPQGHTASSLQVLESKSRR